MTQSTKYGIATVAPPGLDVVETFIDIIARSQGLTPLAINGRRFAADQGCAP